MAENSTLVSLPQLIDLSLNCQEGLVHFHALHALLHILVQQSSLEDVTVEFRGKDGERISGIIAGTNPSPGSRFTEYSVNGSGPKKRKLSKKVSLQDVKEQHKMDKNEKIEKIETTKEKELRVIERRKNSKEDPDLNPLPLKSPPASMYGDQTIVLVDSDTGLPQVSVAVSKRTFENLQLELQKVKTEVRELKELPGNMGLIEATRDKNSPILNMFQILTLTKRLEGAEESVGKLGSLMEDLVNLSPAQGPGQQAAIERIQDVRRSMVSIDAETSSRKGSVRAGGLELAFLEQRVNELEKYVSNLATKGFQGQGDSDGGGTAGKDESRKKGGAGGKSSFKGSVLDGIHLSELPTDQAFDLVQQEFSGITSWVDESLNERTGDGGDVNLGDMESKLTECTKQMQQFDSVYNNQITLLNQQLTNLQTEMDQVLNKIDVVLPGGDSTGINAETTMELANKLLLLEKEIMSVSQHAKQLQNEKGEIDKTIDTINEQIDILKIVKANREDLEDALGDKADACQINRKVSHDQFDAACDDLSRGIEDALGKLQEQEEMWRHALDTIQKDVGNKLDKNEVDPLRDFVNSKLKALQERFKTLASLKKEQEAAGTKSKLLRDVNCISCDKDVVMRKEMDISMKPKPYAMPPPKNMAPYLAYELDQLRKQQKCVPGSKNLNFLESAMKSKKDKEHICNRYCGGSHTVTTPQQRVARLGHFLEQWGPDIAPMHDQYVRGNDGQMYKARNDDKIPKKPSKPEAPVAEKPSTSGGETPKEDKSERATVINSSAERLLTEEKKDKEKGDLDKKHSIGSSPIRPKMSLSQDKALRIASNKSFQGSVEGDPNPPAVGAFRPSRTSDLRVNVPE